MNGEEAKAPSGPRRGEEARREEEIGPPQPCEAAPAAFPAPAPFTPSPTPPLPPSPAAARRIVRNQILIDVQGGDVLMQIFTAPVLQRRVGDEAPFLEFIQRVCAAPDDDPIPRAGCGGFGIRNFLALFLSIEASKAMEDERAATGAGRAAEAAFHRRRVGLFTQQLEEANPILNAISDAMAVT